MNSILILCLLIDDYVVLGVNRITSFCLTLVNTCFIIPLKKISVKRMLLYVKRQNNVHRSFLVVFGKTINVCEF